MVLHDTTCVFGAEPQFTYNNILTKTMIKEPAAYWYLAAQSLVYTPGLCMQCLSMLIEIVSTLAETAKFNLQRQLQTIHVYIATKKLSFDLSLCLIQFYSHKYN